MISKETLIAGEEFLDELCYNSSKDFDEISLELVNDLLQRDINYSNIDGSVIKEENEDTSSTIKVNDFQLSTPIGNSPLEEYTTPALMCRVCGALAHGYNFDQITCESCKAFFRRNALRNMQNLKCRFTGNCDIDIKNRRLCTYCRLKKCFDIQMRKEWIRTEGERQIRQLKKLTKQQKPLNKLSSDELKCIGNLPLVVHRKKRLKSLVLKNVKQERVPRIEPIYPIRTLATHRNLIDENRTILNNIVNSYKFGAERADFSHMNRYTSTSTLTQFLNDETTMYESLIYYFKQIPEFRQHSLGDQISLIKYNVLDLIHLHHIVVQDFHVPLHIGPHMSRWMGSNFHEQMLEARKKYDCFMKYPLILKISMIVFIFSINLSTPHDSSQFMDYTNKEQIYESQSFYALLLWRYLNYLFDEREAIRAMQFIVMQILRFQTLMTVINENIHKNNLQSDFNPLMRSVLRLT
ncbi:unnamed protein product [Rotaria magnacalcarata]|uniref:Nuclear receptor domain-containing protein n=1 Tax=Rotaria magnacalcarata TaxID=392030 RepID=A0A818YG79_9BILA|nr:unnamed protein product [Rotaria magnacalcarata]CAF3754582.1 unnamed protein product [Rotaria magnacalcarata]